MLFVNLFGMLGCLFGTGWFYRKNESHLVAQVTKNLKKQLITNPEELKNLYSDTFRFRLRQRPAKPDYETFLQLQEELFKMRLETARRKKTPAWQMKDLEEAIKTLKRSTNWL